MQCHGTLYVFSGEWLHCLGDFCLFQSEKVWFCLLYIRAVHRQHLVGTLAVNFAEVMLALVFIQQNIYPECRAL